MQIRSDGFLKSHNKIFFSPQTKYLLLSPEGWCMCLNMLSWTLLMLYCQSVAQAHYVVMRWMMIFIFRSQVKASTCVFGWWFPRARAQFHSACKWKTWPDLSTRPSIDRWSGNAIFLQDRGVDPLARLQWRQLLHFLRLLRWDLKLQTFWWHVCTFLCSVSATTLALLLRGIKSFACCEDTS